MLKRFTGLIVAVLLLLAPVIAGAATGSYKIQPGDTLQLQVLQDSSLNRTMLVLPDGTVTVPMVGSVKAGGLTLDAVRTAITQALAPSFTSSPTVYLSVGAIAPSKSSSTATITVYVMGEVAKPGGASVKPGTTLLQALAITGGFTNYAATKRIELLRQDSRGQQQVYHFNYQALIAGANTPAIVLREGDVIVVPQRRLFE